MSKKLYKVKLYKVKCRGMQGGFGVDVAHGLAFVVAENPSEAHERVLGELNRRYLGFHLGTGKRAPCTDDCERTVGLNSMGIK